MFGDLSIRKCEPNLKKFATQHRTIHPSAVNQAKANNMMSNESIHRRLKLAKGNTEVSKRKQAPPISFLSTDEEENDIVIPCVTEDEEDGMALPAQDLPYKEKKNYSYCDENEENIYDVETYLKNYEIMLQRQDDENVATLSHLKPMLEVLEAMVEGRMATSIPNSETIYYDRTTLLKEFSLRDLQQAANRLQVKKTEFDFIQTDRQFMLVLELLSGSNVVDTSQKISWAELVHLYKICVSGMQALEDLPKGRIRNQARERTMSSLQLFRNYMPKSISKENKEISRKSHSSLSSSRRRALPRSVPEEMQRLASNTDEISFLKLVIAFLMGLTITIISVTVLQRTPTVTSPNSMELILEQLLERAEIPPTGNVQSSELNAFSATPVPNVDLFPITSVPLSVQEAPIAAAVPSVLTTQLQNNTNSAVMSSTVNMQPVSTPDVVDVGLETVESSRPMKKNEPLPLYSPSLSLNEKMVLLGAAGISIVGPAIAHAALALSSSVSLLPIGVAVFAATLMKKGIRDFLFGWLRNFFPNKSPGEEDWDSFF
eukprot:scaffold721_cov131-Cylindrotheca_fusiformis.AAC.18